MTSSASTMPGDTSESTQQEDGTPSPLVSFVVIEYQCADIMSEAIAAIGHNADSQSYEIIISSNSIYPEEEQAALREKHPNARWVFNTKNGGFAAGMNAGIRVARGTFIVIINPDARPIELKPENISAWFAAHPQAGLVGPRCTAPDGAQQDCVRRFMTLPRFFLRQVRRLFYRATVLHEHGFDYDREQPVDWVIGGCMIIRRECLASVGLLDEGYFLYVEDMDWCKRFWDAGFEVWYAPSFGVMFAADRKSTTPLTCGKASRYTGMHLRSYLRFLSIHGLFPKRAKG